MLMCLAVIIIGRTCSLTPLKDWQWNKLIGNGISLLELQIRVKKILQGL